MGVEHEYPESPQIAVGAIVIKDGHILMVKRGRPPGQGMWAIPGGCVELGETMQEAAEREVKEETGIIIRALNPVHTFDLIDRNYEGRVRFHYLIVDLVADYVSGEPHAGGDATEARWIACEELHKLPASQTTREVLRKMGKVL